MGDLVKDAVQYLWRRRRRAAAAVATMALGIGACVAIFGISHAVLLAAFPYADPARLAIIWHARAGAPRVVATSPADYESYRTSLTMFESVGAVTTRGYNVGTAAPARVTCARVSPEILPMLGVHPARGRWFTADEDARAAPVVLIGDRFWRSAFGGDAGAVGRDVRFDAVSHRVIGVMPATFVFPPEGVQGLVPADCWMPTSFTPAERAVPSFGHVLFARIKRGVSEEQAAADANAGAHRIWTGYPAAVQSQVKLEARLVTLADQVVGRSRTPVYMFSAAAALLLLIACANVSSLLLTQLESRRRELAVRAALGATRARLITQLLVEALVLSCAGGAAGLAIAFVILRAVTAYRAGSLPRLGDAGIEVPVLMFALACSVVAGLLGGLAPAVQSRRLAAQMSSQRTGARAFARRPWKRALIGFEIALAVVLLVFTGLLMRTVVSLNAVNPGFVPGNLVTFAVALPPADYPSTERVNAFVDQILTRLGELPGVEHAAVASASPIGAAGAAVVLPVEEVGPSPKYRPSLLHSVSEGYLAALGIPLRAGRFLERSDHNSAAKVGVVNQALARALWPDATVIGRQIVQLGVTGPITIVGVIDDVRQSGLQSPAAPALYVPMSQTTAAVRTLTFVLRTRDAVGVRESDARALVQRVDSALPVHTMRTGEDLIDAGIAGPRFNLLVLAVFASLAVALAASGIYGVLTQSVEDAQREFGIRQALGATTGRIVTMVLRYAIPPALAGVIVGAGVSSAGASLASALLFGVQPNDRATHVAVAAVVMGLSCLAAAFPAYRAARSELMLLLRQE